MPFQTTTSLSYMISSKEVVRLANDVLVEADDGLSTLRKDPETFRDCNLFPEKPKSVIGPSLTGQR